MQKIAWPIIRSLRVWAKKNSIPPVKILNWRFCFWLHLGKQGLANLYQQNLPNRIVSGRGPMPIPLAVRRRISSLSPI